MKKWLLVGSLALNGFFALSMGLYAVVFRQEIIKHYIDSFGTVRVLMLGDSHSQWGSWNIGLKRTDVDKLAMAGYTSEQVLKLSGSVFKYPHVQKIFVLAGTNDILAKHYNRSETLNNLFATIDTLQAHHIEPILQTIPYQTNSPAFNKSADSLNAGIRSFCQSKRIRLLDLNQLTAINHALPVTLARDNTHLNAQGYAIWYQAVDKMID